MEGSRENPNGAGGHHDDAASRKTQNALRSMANDLGAQRLEDLAQDDDRLSRGGRMRATGAPAKPKPLADNNWQNAVQSNLFEDSDAKEWQDLDSIADGRLHAERRDARARGGNGPLGLGMVQAAQSNGGAQNYFANPARGSQYDPRNPQRRGGARRLARGSPIHLGSGGPTHSGRGGSTNSGRGHHHGPDYSSGQVSRLGIVVPPGAQVFTFENSRSVAPTSQPAPPPSQPIQLRLGGSAPLPSGISAQPQPQRNEPTIFDAPHGTSTLNNNQKRSASHQEGSNTLFSRASVAGVATPLTLSSSQTDGSTNTPSHKRLKETLPHLRPASVRPEAIASGSAPYAGVTEPPQNLLSQRHPGDPGKLPRSTLKSQPDVDVLFESKVDIKCAQRDTDGTIPDSGKVLLYMHPGCRGWMIWELQGNNGFITRDDVRAFFPAMPLGSSVIFRRRLPDEHNKVAYTHNLVFPSRVAAQELPHLIEEGQKRMNHINRPWFQQGPLKVERLGLVDAYTLLEVNRTSGSTQSIVQLSTGYNQANSQAVQQATRGLTGAQSANHNEDHGDDTIPPHKRSVKNIAPVQASENIEGNSLVASRSTQNGTSRTQEDSASSLIDTMSPTKENPLDGGVQASPMLTKLIEIEAEDKGKRPASEDLRDLTYKTSLLSTSAEPVGKQPFLEANGGASKPSSRPNPDVAKQVDHIDANTPKHDTLDQQLFSRPEGASGTNYINATSSGENDASQNDNDHTDNQGTSSKTNELGNEPEQDTGLVQVPTHNTIKINDVKGKLPIRNLSSASKDLVMGMTRAKYVGMIDSVKGLWNACVQMDMFSERRLENATLLATWQALYQNPAFRRFNGDDKLSTVAFVYDKYTRKRSIIDALHPYFHAFSWSGCSLAFACTTQGAGQIDPSPDLSQPREQQVAVESNPAFVDTPDHSSSPITPALSASSEANTLGQNAHNTKMAIKQEDREPAIKAEPQLHASSSASQVSRIGANWKSQTPAKQEEMVSVARPPTPSPLTPIPNSQVPGNRTGSQGPSSVFPHMRGMRQNLGSAGLSGSRWA
ncbi:uncharacterized protein PG986_011163 [Apiospora aurea]|uniref:Uncharacterized protein n=1 Tax=Apiospora aurea TaxID=335848 RepID=A0ABR1Q4D2_9PEZI